MKKLMSSSHEERHQIKTEIIKRIYLNVYKYIYITRRARYRVQIWVFRVNIGRYYTGQKLIAQLRQCAVKRCGWINSGKLIISLIYFAV